MLVANRISRTVFSALRLFVIIVSSSGYDELKLSLRQSDYSVQLGLTGYSMYVFRWSYLIDKYDLSAHQLDKAKIKGVLGDCDLN